ncbi:MAG TPA: hypothetical protein VMB50_11230 [Myxococcales bacterium]|nr:hypothetical protein [Myxococcales bacterium]
MEKEQAGRSEQAAETGPVRAVGALPGGAERELAELRREVLEARNLVIKSDNLLRGLHAEVKAFGKRQEEAERRSVFSSAVAYACFALLCALGATAAARGWVASARDDAAQSERQAAAAEASAASLKTEVRAREAASEAAARAYAQIAGDSAGRLDGIAALGKLDRKLLTPLEARALDDRASEARQQAAASALDRGRTAFRRNDFKTAAAELGRYFQSADPAAADVLASLDLGVSLWQEREFEPAAAQLSRFLALGKGLKNRDYAALLLGESLEGAGRPAQAEDVYKSGLAEHAESEFAPQMRHRLYKLEHQGPPSGTAKAGAGPAAPSAG